jgi:hypothetical protein
VIGRALAAVAAVVAVAHADSKPPPDPPKPSEPKAEVGATPAPEIDPRSEEQASEANLVSNAPRAGVTFSGAIGGGLVLGDGVGRGPAASFRLGHVATSKTVITFELSIASLLHEPMGDTRTHHNDIGHAMAGALVYVGPSLWLRGAGGLSIYTVDDPGQSSRPHPGVGGLVGLGVDFVRWHYLVLGLEWFTAVSIVSTRGAMLDGGICLGLSYY